MRAAWRERNQRPGWDVSYTVIGGRFPSDVLSGVSNDLAETATRAVSQAMVAVSGPSRESEASLAFWASVVRKVVQRGTRPIIHHADASLFNVSDPSPDELLAAIAGPVETVWDIDPSIELHPTYEAPF